MVYEDSQKRIDEILDKISKYGIFSMTNREKDFLNAYSSGNEDEIIDKLSILDKAIVFENAYFKFEINESIIKNHEVIHKGTLYVPDIILDNTKIDGNINGELIVYKNGTYILNFDKKVNFNGNEIIYEIYEFCDGLEYELDSFIDYIIIELS